MSDLTTLLTLCFSTIGAGAFIMLVGVNLHRIFHAISRIRVGEKVEFWKGSRR